MSGYVFDWPQLLRQMARARDAARVTVAVVLRLPSFSVRYRRAYAHARAGEALPEDAPAMRPFTFLALVVVLTTLLTPLARRLAGLPAQTDSVEAAQRIVDPGVTVVHLARLTGMETLDGFIADGVMIASYALFAALFRLVGGRAFDFPWIAGFFAYVVGAFEAVLLVAILAAIATNAADPALAATLTAGIGLATLAATLAYALLGPIVVWPAVLAVPRGRVVRVTVLAVVLWSVLQATVRIAFWISDVLLLGFGL